MKKDNRGVSLVELVIAVMILAIVVLPFLNSFVTSARTNQKAKRIMRATTVAENIMEAMNPLTLEEVALQLSNDGDPAHMPVCKLAPVFATHEELLIHENDATDPALGITPSTVYSGSEWQFVGQDSDVYYYAMTGVEVDSKTYDTLIRLDASDYYAAAGATPLYNDEEVVHISGLDLSKDVLYQLETKDEKKVYAEFAERSTRHEADPAMVKHADDFKGVLTREVEISIVKDGTDYEVNLDLTYTAPVGWVADSEREYHRTMQLFKGAEIRNIYILYPPNYKSVVGSVKDEFTIYNYDKANCSVYFIKQVSLSAAEMLSKEMQYVPMVKLMEATSGAEISLPAVTDVFSNFTINLGKREMGSANFTMTDPAVYSYNGQSGSAIENLFMVGNLLDEKSENRIYRAEVRVYDAGAYQGPDTPFDESKFITSLSN